jgi:hypothetical protein
MSEKKSSSGKESSVDVMPSVVVQKRFPKTDRSSPVQVHKRRGSGGLLSRRPVHAGREDGEGVAAAQGSGGERRDVIQCD